MSGALQGTTITVVYPIAIACRWQDENTVDRWITDNGGKHVANKFITETTHLVCGSDAWAAPAPAVKIALRAKDEFGHRVKIVTPEWLEDTLDVGPGDGLRRTSEGPFLCEKTEQADSVAAETPAQNAVVKANKRAHGGPRTRMRWMTEMLHESTEKFISEEVQRRIDIEVEARMQAALSAAKVDARKKTEEQDKQRRARRKRAAFLRRRGLKARNGTLSDHHHVYMDENGFKYEVLLTKVDTWNDCNERYALTLQIYESNAAPHTYAMNLYSANTGHLPSSNVIVAIGCNLPTACRAFKKVFKEKTFVEWDERFSFIIGRTEREYDIHKRSLDGSLGRKRGRPACEEMHLGKALMAPAGAESFSRRPFAFHFPPYESRGVQQQRRRLRQKEEVEAEGILPNFDSGTASQIRTENIGVMIMQSGEAELPPEQLQKMHQSKSGDQTRTSVLEEPISGSLEGVNGAESHASTDASVQDPVFDFSFEYKRGNGEQEPGT